MYEQYYGFSALPFAVKPAANHYYFNEQHRSILDELELCLRQGNCVCMVDGAYGVGKNTLIKSLCERVKGRIGTYSIDTAHLTDETSLRQELLSVLGAESSNDDIQSPFKEQLASRLDELCKSGQRGVLVINEADVLEKPDREVLSSLVGSPSLQLLLTCNQLGSESAGFPEIADNVICRFTLAPLSAIETETYIRTRLLQAGGSREVFTPPAIEAIYRYSGGYPRLINRVCDLVLVYGFSHQSEQIDKQKLDLMMSERWDGSFQGNGEFEEDNVAFQMADSALSGESGEAASTGPPAGGVWGQGSQQYAEYLTQNEIGRDSGQQRLAELMRRSEQHGMQASSMHAEDVYEFIRLSAQQQQRHCKRFMLGVVSCVVLVAVASVVGFALWQPSEYLPARLAVAVPAEPELLIAPGQLQAFGKETVPVVEQAALEVPQPVETVDQTSLILRIEAETLALQEEYEKLAEQRQLLENELAAERTETKRLKRNSARDKKRMAEIVTQARKNAGLMWSEINKSAPEAYSEDD